MNPPNEAVCFASADGFFTAVPAWEFLDQDPDRYGDLAGPQIASIMRQLSWRYTAEPVCVMALDPKGCALAIGWAGKTNWGDAGGVNLSYAAATHMEGRGLALLATSLALVETERRGLVDQRHRVHAQFDLANTRSAALAARLGLLPDSDLDVRCAVPATRWHPPLERHLVGASAPWDLALARARSIAGDRLVIAWTDRPPPHRQRERA